MPDELQFLDPELTRHWRYYLLLESELETALRYVEPSTGNANTYSIEFARQILATCAQFETVARLLCSWRVHQTPRGIQQVMSHLNDIGPGLPGWRTRFYPQNEVVAPFSDWSRSKMPAWWNGYNRLKHEPSHNLPYATLTAAVRSVAALGLTTVQYLGVNAQPGTSRLFDLVPY